MVAWGFSGNVEWIRQFFQVPAALLMLLLDGTQLWLSLVARRQFSPGEPMRSVWTLIALSAACDLFGDCAIQVLGLESRLNPVAGWWSHAAIQQWSTAGHLAGGLFRFALLAAGLYRALRAYRQAR